MNDIQAQAVGTDLQVVHRAVLSMLRYYGVFRHPLTATEILRSSFVACDLEDVRCVLNTLKETHQVYEFKGHYSLSADIHVHLQRRRSGERRAKTKIPSAVRAARLIYAFPFVRFVGISGSLSKGYSSSASDFDFFIITEAKRLWISRTILHLFKKLTFLVGKQHHFCMNYFIDSKQLEIDEKNLFTAIEINSLVPVAGKQHYRHFIESNRWVDKMLPNTYSPFFAMTPRRDRRSLIKILSETVLNFFGDRLNQYLMDFTDRRWRAKWSRKGYPPSDYELAFKTTLHVSKNHPDNNQKRLLKTIGSENS